MSIRDVQYRWYEYYVYCDVSVCDIWYKIIYYRYKLILHHFIQVIYNATVFALFFGSLKMSDRMVILFLKNLRSFKHLTTS